MTHIWRHKLRHCLINNCSLLGCTISKVINDVVQYCYVSIDNFQWNRIEWMFFSQNIHSIQFHWRLSIDTRWVMYRWPRTLHSCKCKLVFLGTRIYSDWHSCLCAKTVLEDKTWLLAAGLDVVCLECSVEFVEMLNGCTGVDDRLTQSLQRQHERVVWERATAVRRHSMTQTVADHCLTSLKLSQFAERKFGLSTYLDRRLVELWSMLVLRPTFRSANWLSESLSQKVKSSSLM